MVYRVESNSSLVVEGVRRHQGGKFLCSASNGVRPDLSKSVTVTVKGRKFGERIKKTKIIYMVENVYSK